MNLTEQLIKECLHDLRINQQSKQNYQDYYEGNHSILKDYRMQDSRSNMKLVFSYPKKFVDNEVGYILGEPVNYISKSDDSEIINSIDLHLSHWDKYHNQELRKQSEIFGESYELEYINADGEFSAMVLNPINCFVVTDGTAENNVILALYLFTRKFDENKYLDVYFGKEIIHYKLDGEDLENIGTDTHIFDRVPITTCPANSEKSCGFKDIISLVDAYNALNSDLVNEIADFRNSYICIEGATIEEEDLKKMKSMGIIQVPNNAKVYFLTKQINDSFVQNELNNIEKKIYDLSDQVNFNENWASNTSSLALKNKLINLENRCALKESIMEKVLKQRLRNFFLFIQKKTGRHFDYRDIAIKFTRNLPVDLASTAQIITQLQNVASQETLLSLLNFVENPKAELEKYRREQEYNMIDLDKVDNNEEKS